MRKSHIVCEREMQREEGEGGNSAFIGIGVLRGGDRRRIKSWLRRKIVIWSRGTNPDTEGKLAIDRAVRMQSACGRSSETPRVCLYSGWGMFEIPKNGLSSFAHVSFCRRTAEKYEGSAESTCRVEADLYGLSWPRLVGSGEG